MRISDWSSDVCSSDLYAGDSDGAIESLNKAIRLNPLDPLVFLTQSAMGFAHFIAGRDDDAARWAAMALRVKPNWLRSEERRVGKACVSTFGYRWSTCH